MRPICLSVCLIINLLCYILIIYRYAYRYLLYDCISTPFPCFTQKSKLVHKVHKFSVLGITAMFRRFCEDNPTEKLNARTFYRAIYKYHKDTGVDALLIQGSDHNVDATDKVLRSLIDSEHTKANMAKVKNDHETAHHHESRKQKLQEQLDVHTKNKRDNRLFDAEFLYLAITLRDAHFRAGLAEESYSFTKSKLPLISYKHTDDKSDVNLPSNLQAVIYFLFD